MKLLAMRWPEELMESIDAAAAEAGTSRSEWIRTACRERLKEGRCAHPVTVEVGAQLFCDECGEDITPARV